MIYWVFFSNKFQSTHQYLLFLYVQFNYSFNKNNYHNA